MTFPTYQLQVWTLHALPRRENRYGWELQCEVVKASDAL